MRITEVNDSVDIYCVNLKSNRYVLRELGVGCFAASAAIPILNFTHAQVARDFLFDVFNDCLMQTLYDEAHKRPCAFKARFKLQTEDDTTKTKRCKLQSCPAPQKAR